MFHRVSQAAGNHLRKNERIRSAVRRARRRWRSRSRPGGAEWAARAERQWSTEERTYLDLPLDAARHIYGGKSTLLHQICLALRPSVVVELGSGFSWYDFGRNYEDAIKKLDEGLSTRVLLSAARLLTSTGTPCHVYSVDLRDPERLRSRLAQDFGLDDHLTYALGCDSVAWMRDYCGTVGVLFTDSRHTRAQVLAELDAALPKMTERAAIIVDNCYTTDYDNEPAEDVARGGKYGALIEWAASHPDWTPTWTRHDALLLSRGWVP